jgi:recombination protein RecR
MSDYAEPIERLIDEFRKLPGIGSKSAQRLVYSIMRRSRENAERLSNAILEVKDKILFCSRCNNYSDRDPCEYCNNSRRTSETICVVEEPHDILAIERTREYHGQYHVLHGVLSPINGVGPEDLKLKNLLERLREGNTKEMGIPVGSDLEYADEITMSKALEHRHEI